MGSTTQRVEVLLLALLLALVAAIVVVVGVVRPRPVPVVADVQPLGSSASGTPAPPASPAVSAMATVLPTAAPTATVVPTATAAPTTMPTVGVPTTLPSVVATPLPRPDTARQTGLSAWWIGGGAALLLGLAPVVVYLRRRRTRQETVPMRMITSSLPGITPPLRVAPCAVPTGEVAVQRAKQDPGISEYADAERPDPAQLLLPLLDERPVLPTLELGNGAAADRMLLSRSLLTDAPDDAAEPEGEPVAQDADRSAAATTLPLALAVVIRDALVATETRSVWLGLEWRERHATALFAFADDADATLVALAERIAAATGTRCRWTTHGLQIGLPPMLDPGPRPWPLLVPVLMAERGATRALLLDRWRHLALYGAQAVGVTHQILTQLLTEHAPDELAVALIDPQKLLGTLYHTAPHRFLIDQPPALVLGQCLHALRQGYAATARPLLVVVVDPDDATITALLLLLRWLQPAAHAPLHLLVVATGVRAAGRDLYALLPGLVTAGGSGDARLLPGAPEQWPRGGTAQVVSRAGRWSGQLLVLDETTVAATLAQLPPCDLANASPTLWHLGRGADALAGVVESSPIAAVVATRSVPTAVPSTPTASAARPPAGALAPAALAPVVRTSLVVTPDPADDGDVLVVSPVLAAGDRSAARLEALIDGAREVPRAAVHTAPPEALPDAADAAWPADLAPVVRAGDLRALWTTIVDDGGYHPTLRGGNGATTGLTLRRLRGLAPEPLQAALPRLLVWFDRAGLLHAPAREDVPFGMPRLPMSTDLAWIAQQLVATPPPALDDPLVLMLSRKRERTP